MPAERLTPEQAKIVQIVDSKMTDFESQLGNTVWDGFPGVGAFVRLRFYTEILITTYSTGDTTMFFKEMGKTPVFQEFLDGFYRDVAEVVGTPFPSSTNESMLEVAHAAKNGLDAWRAREQSSK